MVASSLKVIRHPAFEIRDHLLSIQVVKGFVQPMRVDMDGFIRQGQAIEVVAITVGELDLGFVDGGFQGHGGLVRFWGWVL